MAGKWQRFDIYIPDLSADAQYRLNELQKAGYSQADILDKAMLQMGDVSFSPPATDDRGNLIREIRVGKNGHRTIVTGGGDALYDFIDWLIFSEPKRVLSECPAKITRIGFEFN